MDEWYNDFPHAHVNNLDGVGYAIEVNNNDMLIDIVRKKYLNSFIKIRNANIKDIAKSDYKYLKLKKEHFQYRESIILI